VRLGFACIAVGSAWLAAGADSAVPIAVVCGAAILMGFGMGLGYASISVVMLVEAEPGREGAASASLSLTDVLATAVSTGVAGAAIALADTWHWAPSSGIVLAFALPVTAGLAGAVLAQRLPARPPERHADVGGLHGGAAERHAGARRDDGDGELQVELKRGITLKEPEQGRGA
jgi:MFS family permease